MSKKKIQTCLLKTIFFFLQKFFVNFQIAEDYSQSRPQDYEPAKRFCEPTSTNGRSVSSSSGSGSRTLPYPHSMPTSPTMFERGNEARWDHTPNRTSMYDFLNSTDTLKSWTEKWAINKTFCFSSDFDETWWSCSIQCVLQFHQVSSKSDEK